MLDRPCTGPTLRAFSFIVSVGALARSAPCMQDCSFPTYPLARTMSQPDGREVELFFRGNARNHWYEDLAGYPVVDSKQGFFYARRAADGSLIATEWSVGTVDPRSLALERAVVPAVREDVLAPSAAALAKGVRGAGTSARAMSPGPRGPFALGSASVTNLVLLVRFSNHGPAGQNRALPSASDVSIIMNAVGGHPTLAWTGSVRDHYLQTSYGQFTLDSDVAGWLDLPNTETYYANGSAGTTTLTWDMITDALDLADATVDFGDYDEDGDGWVDAITVLHSGYGAEWGGNDQYGTNYFDRIWSHKWTIPTWTSAEGVKVGDYNISPGLWGTSGSAPGRIGVVCHELAHFFGLPDLYDLDSASYGAGYWCLMANGAWGFGASQWYPSHLSAWSKLRLGWAPPLRILPGSHNAATVETNPAVYMIESGYLPGEFLLVENRQPVGFDAAIPQGGLAIWHVDEAKGSLAYNDPNDDEGFPAQAGWPANNNHYRVALLQADGSFNLEHGFNRGDSTDVYRSGFATVLDAATTPNTNAYQGGAVAANLNRIQGIAASSSNMAFTYVNTGAPTVTTASVPLAKVGVAYSTAMALTGGSAPFIWSEFIDDPSYTLADLGAQPFAMGGVAQGWNAEESTWPLNLSFQLPYYEGSYSKVYVTPNGTIDFLPLENEPFNTLGHLRLLPRIAGMWDDLATDGAGEDIYVDTSIAGQVRIRWQAEDFATASPANFAITLFSSGKIRFEYGAGNTNLTPTVGISRGHSRDMLIAVSHDGQSTLTSANALEYTLLGSQLPPGLALSASGVLSGTPTTEGTYSLRVRVTDNARRYDEQLLTVDVIFDCNANDVADSLDISRGGSEDDNGNAVPDECEGFDGEPYCFGDGIDSLVTAGCPCSNLGLAGHGCANSNTSFGGAKLTATGATTPNSLTFHCAGVPNNTLCTFLRGTANDPAGVVFGDGVRCAGGTVLRFGQQNAGQGGNPANTAAAPAATVPSGTTRFYQCQYRNPTAGWCPPELFNVSNGFVVVW